MPHPLLALAFAAVAASAAFPTPGAVVDSRSPAPFGTVLRGHAEDPAEVARLIEELERRDPAGGEPELRSLTRAAAGYEFVLVLPLPPAPPAVPGPGAIQPQPHRVRFDSPAFEELTAFLLPPTPSRYPLAGALVLPPALPPIPRRDPPAQRTSAAEGHPLAVNIDDLTVEEIERRASGDLAWCRAYGLRLALRAGTVLLDGQVDGIDFARPTVAWVRFRRRGGLPPGIPYRPVVWLLVGDSNDPNGPAEPGRRGGGILLSIGGTGRKVAEIHRLGDGQLARRGLPPWTWELASTAAPRLAAAMVGAAGEINAAGSPPRLRLQPGFGTVDIRFPSRPQLVAAVAGEMRARVAARRRSGTAAGWAFPLPRPADRPRKNGGYSIDDLDILSVFKTPDGPLAEVAGGPSGPFFFLRPGDRLADVEITQVELGKDQIAFLYRDPEPDGPPPRRRAALAGLTCAALAASDPDTLEDVLDAAGRLLARPSRKAGDFLADVAAAGALLGELEPLERLRLDPAPQPAEILALLGDLDILAGRPGAASEAYSLASILSPGQETLCGRLTASRLYGVESYRASPLHPAGPPYRLTGYLLAWDLDSARVAERLLLPAPPESFAGDGEDEALTLTLRRAGAVDLAALRLAADPLPADLFQRVRAFRAGELLAANFLEQESEPASRRFAVRRQFDPRLPLSLPELEDALRQAARRDPTQPWHPFFLGQALWAEGRRAEAETVWRELWAGGPWAVPYYEILRMAIHHERFGQGEWADRVYALALAARRRLPPPIAAALPSERQIDAGNRRLALLVGDPDRRYLWWQRVREISGHTMGDAFRAVLWAAERERRGDRRQARLESEVARRARRDPYDETLCGAGLDSLYGLAAALAMLVAHLAVLGGRLAGRLTGRLTGLGARRPEPRQRRRLAFRAAQGAPLLVLTAGLVLAGSLCGLTASYAGFLAAQTFDSSDAVTGESAATAGTPPPSLRALLHAGITSGAVLPASGEPAPVVRRVRALRQEGLGRLAQRGLALGILLFVIALPAGLLLAWRPARDVLALAIPGAALVRRGARLRGYAVFGLAVFAVLPLAWVLLARTQAAVPAPGPVSANLFVSATLEETLVPLAPPDGGSPAGDAGISRRNLERLCAASYPRLLAVYPGAGPFWLLVLAALATVLALHGRLLWRAWRERGGDRRPGLQQRR